MNISAREFLESEENSQRLHSDAFEAAFFTDIRTSNGSWKTTRRGRLEIVDDVLFDVIARRGLVPKVVMDVGISSGITTVDWLAAFKRNGFSVRAIATDRTMLCYVARLGKRLDVLFEPNGHILRADLLGHGIRLWCSRRDYLSGLCLWKWLLARYIRLSCRRRGIVFPPATDEAGAPHRDHALLGPYKMVTPELRACADVVLLEDDLLEINPAALAGVADVVRLANIVNYFSDAELRRIVHNVRGRCRDGALVVICREVEDCVEGSILRAVPGGSFVVECRVGPGSEVERYFCEAKT